MPDTHQRQLQECEARDWLRRGYSTPTKVAELEQLITSKRGAAAAARLVEEMRRQWQRRAEWLK